ncbi:MFS transporter [Streptomyces gamaensis]|uniref:MFS transporter n=1 Tax=Streptomyces gamaensis TaxID=1763542 RepID=A0ABW0Z6V3_9ACTN
MTARTSAGKSALTQRADGHPRRWFIHGAVVAGLLMVIIDTTILNVALTTLADPVSGLGATQGQLQWATNGYVLVFGGLLFTSGVLGDRIGRRKLLIGGIVVFGAGSLVASLAESPATLIAARALMGAGGAAIMPQTLAIITNVFGDRERGRAIALWGAAIGTSVAIGPVVGGFLLEHFWWGSIFMVNIPVALVALAAVALVVPELKGSPGGFDPLGVALSFVGLVAMIWGIVHGGETSQWLSPAVVTALAVGIVTLALFVRHEMRTRFPAFDVRLFRDSRLSAAVGAVSLAFFAVGGVYFFISLYLQSVRGLSPLHAGLMMLPFALAQLFLAPRSVALAQRFGTRAVVAGGLGMTLAAVLLMQAVDAGTSPWLLIVIFLLWGGGMANVVPPATSSIMSVLSPAKAGAGAALNSTAQEVSIALGVAVLGSLVSTVYRSGITDALGPLPHSARAGAAESITGALAETEKLDPSAAAALAGQAQAAFTDAMHLAAGVAVVALGLGMAATLKWMPGRTPHAAPDNNTTAQPAEHNA